MMDGRDQFDKLSHGIDGTGFMRHERMISSEAHEGSGKCKVWACTGSKGESSNH